MGAAVCCHILRPLSRIMLYRITFALCLIFALSSADDQHDALMDLHTHTGGSSWTRRDGWGTGDYCTWFGVTCKHDPPETSQVTDVVLSGNNLAGVLPESILKLRSLKVLKLDGNQISGAVPSGLASLDQLQMVHLQKNKFTGSLPATMMNLTVAHPPMQEIDLSYNQLSGAIPETLFGPENPGPFAPTDNLKVFNLRYNAISGGIPARIIHASTMISILLGGNNMTGVIDGALDSWLTSRKYCDLSGNSWSCPLPKGVGAKCQAVCK